MKTQKEIEDMLSKLSKEISELQDKMDEVVLDAMWLELHCIELQKMSQYNILLEVLK